MARPKVSDDQKKREGEKLRFYIKRAKMSDRTITQESLGAEIGLTQGLVGQWCRGQTAIPDKHLLWLGSRLGFNPVEFRPSVAWAVMPSSPTPHRRLAEVIEQIPPGKEDYIAGILAPILEALKGHK